jgi:hypothetical protein
MERPSYQTIATAIADAMSPEARAAASTLATNYYAIEPPLETVRQRMSLLKEALLASLERDNN